MPEIERGLLDNIRLAFDTLTGRLQVDVGGGSAIGEVQTSPTANTVLGRLKDLWVLLASATSFSTGEKTSITAAAALSTTSVPCRAVIVQAKLGNSEALLIGNAAGQYFSLAAGSSISLKVTDVNLVYVKQSSSGTLGANWISIP